jgi:hypothetical protein
LVYGAKVWQIPTTEINKILSTEMDVLRRSARKSRMERIKNEHIKEKMWMEGVQAAMTKSNLEPDQWIHREEWRLVCGRRRQLL